MVELYELAQVFHLTPRQAEELTSWEIAVARVGAAHENARVKKR